MRESALAVFALIQFIPDKRGTLIIFLGNGFVKQLLKFFSGVFLEFFTDLGCNSRRDFFPMC
jgi:hypothetical protein